MGVGNHLWRSPLGSRNVLLALGTPFVFLFLILFGKSLLSLAAQGLARTRPSVPLILDSSYCSQVRIPVRLPEVQEPSEVN